jgi:hypothetical protein
MIIDLPDNVIIGFTKVMDSYFRNGKTAAEVLGSARYALQVMEINAAIGGLLESEFKDVIYTIEYVDGDVLDIVVTLNNVHDKAEQDKACALLGSFNGLDYKFPYTVSPIIINE